MTHSLTALVRHSTKEILMKYHGPDQARLDGLKRLQEAASQGQDASDLFILDVARLSEAELAAALADPEGFTHKKGKEVESYAMYYPVQSLNPHNKDYSVIPSGSYCYKGMTANGHMPDGRPRWKVNPCPYMTQKAFNGVNVPWCAYLELGGTYGAIEGDHTPERAESDHQKLLAHFGSEENMEQTLPLMLLFDSVKECGVNDVEEETEELELLM